MKQLSGRKKEQSRRDERAEEKKEMSGFVFFLSVSVFPGTC